MGDAGWFRHLITSSCSGLCFGVGLPALSSPAGNGTVREGGSSCEGVCEMSRWWFERGAGRLWRILGVCLVPSTVGGLETEVQ